MIISKYSKFSIVSQQFSLYIFSYADYFAHITEITLTFTNSAKQSGILYIDFFQYELYNYLKNNFQEEYIMTTKYMVTSGFLGSGKTTSMIAFAGSINSRGLGSAAILANDLGQAI